MLAYRKLLPEYLFSYLLFSCETLWVSVLIPKNNCDSVHILMHKFIYSRVTQEFQIHSLKYSFNDHDLVPMQRHIQEVILVLKHYLQFARVFKRKSLNTPLNFDVQIKKFQNTPLKKFPMHNRSLPPLQLCKIQYNVSAKLFLRATKFYLRGA